MAQQAHGALQRGAQYVRRVAQHRGPAAKRLLIPAYLWNIFYGGMAVSYTHLDVYKRQKLQSLSEVEAGGIPRVAVKCVEMGDVYKRQLSYTAYLY